MKVLSGLIYHESNTFNPLPTGVEQFAVLEGEESLRRVASTGVFEAAGIEVIPTVYSMALSSGVVEKEVYETFKHKLLKAAENEPDIDGVWLHLHGAMIVEDVGSAEVDLLQSLRAEIGEDVPIAVTLDPHGNITPELCRLADVIRAYRTIPHVDQPEIEARTARQLVRLMGKKPGKIAYAPVPLVLSGEEALSDDEPLRTILAELDRVETLPGILDASFFVGFAWADVPWNSASVLVVPEGEDGEEKAQAAAEELSKFIMDRADQFKFRMPLLSVGQTIERIRDTEPKAGGSDGEGPRFQPLIVADSGDNTTGGAVGANTELLERILEANPRARVCVTTVFDRNAAAKVSEYSVGDAIELEVGLDLSPASSPVTVSGTVAAKGELLGYMASENDPVGRALTVRSGNVDVVVTDISGSFVTPNHFTRAGLNIDDYDVVVLKQGYLFPKLEPHRGDYFMSLTQGATHQIIRDLEYLNTDLPARSREGH